VDLSEITNKNITLLVGPQHKNVRFTIKDKIAFFHTVGELNGPIKDHRLININQLFYVHLLRVFTKYVSFGTVVNKNRCNSGAPTVHGYDRCGMSAAVHTDHVTII
jgi:hypothetical protein